MRPSAETASPADRSSTMPPTMQRMTNRIRRDEGREPTQQEINQVAQAARARSQALAGHGRKRHGRQTETPADVQEQQAQADQAYAIQQAIQLKRGREARPSRAGTVDNRSGLPKGLKSAVEALSGMPLGRVRVHYNSAKPAQFGALAYTRATDIHLGPGQERHLPHEAWHVVQQAKGFVEPTMQMKGGVPVNDDQVLEHEADVMGAAAMRRAAKSHHS